MAYPCVYGSTGCYGRRSRPRPALICHSTCPGGQTASIANLIARDAGLNIRRELSTLERVTSVAEAADVLDVVDDPDEVDTELIAQVWAASQLVRALELQGITLTCRARYGLHAVLSHAIGGESDEVLWPILADVLGGTPTSTSRPKAT